VTAASDPGGLPVAQTRPDGNEPPQEIAPRPFFAPREAARDDGTLVVTICCAAAAIFLLVLLLLFASLADKQHAVLERAEQTTAKIATGIAGVIDGQIVSAGAVLQALDNVEDVNPDLLPGMITLAVSNRLAATFVHYDDGRYVGDPAWLAIRPDLTHAIAPSGTADRSVAIGLPFATADGRWLLPLLRIMHGADGHRDGIGTALIPLDGMRGLFQQLQTNQGASVTLLRRDGILVAREPEVAAWVGADVSRRPAFRSIVPQTETGSWRGQNIDNKNRIVSWQTLSGGQMIVMAGEYEEELLAEYRQHARETFAAIAAIGVVLLVTVLAIRREFQRRRASEARFRTLVEGATDGFFETDENRRLLFASEGFLQRTRMDPHSAFDPHFFRDTDQAVLKLLREKTDARLPYRDLTLTYGDPSGGSREKIRVSGVPIFDGLGAFRGYRGVASNVTELERGRAAELQSNKMASLGQLAGGVAHDFNNILGAIIGYASFLVDDLPADSRQARYAANISDASRRATELVQQILAFSRADAIDTQLVPLARIVHESAHLLQAALPRTTQVRTIIEAPDVQVFANATQLSQVVLNLAKNAHDAMPRGGELHIRLLQVEAGELDAELLRPSGNDTERFDLFETENGELHLRTGSLDASRMHACIEVCDTGTGLNRVTLQRIYEPFFTTKDKGRGTGLGLPMVHGIVLRAGGALHIATRPGHGTVFRAYLPVARASAVAAPQPAQAAAPVLLELGGTFLVVDDEPAVASMTAELLERAGADVGTCVDPHDALERVRRAPAEWDVVITDQSMPGMRGIDLIEAMHRIRPDLPCILMTGYSDEMTESRALQRGAVAYLLKPVDPAQLRRICTRLLAERDDRQAAGSGTV
jgi:signal transduction histidine kinase/CheY-like chemotaxis protein